MGLLLFVVTPLCLFIIYDMLVRRRGKRAVEAELEAELAALRAAQGDNKESKAAVEDETGAIINSSTKELLPGR